MRKPILLAALIGMLCLSNRAAAEVKLHGLFTDGIVLQQQALVPVWGTADAGEEVHVMLTIDKESGQGSRAVAGKDGAWKVQLNNLPAGGPYTITVKGKTSTIVLKDVLVGEVWLASGQSNMEWTVNNSLNPKETIEKSANPMIRYFQVPKTPNGKPQTELGTPAKGGKAPVWQECGPKTAAGFSAVAYFFARDLQKARKVPVGIIHASWGGTAAERWTSLATMAKHPETKDLKGSDLYNGMIVPLIPYRHQGRHLVSGRIQRQPGRAVQDAVPGHDQELARRLETGQLPVPVRATGSVSTWLGLFAGAARGPAVHGPEGAEHRHGRHHRRGPSRPTSTPRTRTPSAPAWPCAPWPGLS